MTTITSVSSKTASHGPRHGDLKPRRRSLKGLNWIGGSFGWVWLLVTLVPIYWLVITSFKTQANYYATNAFKPPMDPTLHNYQLVIESNFPRYFLNSVIVTAGAVVPALLISFM